MSKNLIKSNFFCFLARTVEQGHYKRDAPSFLSKNFSLARMLRMYTGLKWARYFFYSEVLRLKLISHYVFHKITLEAFIK